MKFYCNIHIYSGNDFSKEKTRIKTNNNKVAITM